MKATLHMGKKGSAKHNDRDFDLTNSDHIDPELTHLNKEIYFVGSQEKSFEENELDYYNEHYGKALELQNEKFKAKRQTDRIKDMEYWRNSDKNKKPDEIILQLGNSKENLGGEFLESCIFDFCQTVNQKYGSNFHMLNMGIHVDEPNGTPHAHLRGVFDYIDTDGIRKIGTAKALEELGIELPKPDEKISRYNNKKITFTKEMRDIWYQIIKEYGIDLDEEVKNPSQKHKETLDYKIEQDKKQIIENAQIIKEQEEQILENNHIGNFKKVVDDTIKTLEEQGRTNPKHGNFANAVIQVIHSFCEHYKVKSSDMKKQEQLQKNNASHDNETR